MCQNVEPIHTTLVQRLDSEFLNQPLDREHVDTGRRCKAAPKRQDIQTRIPNSTSGQDNKCLEEKLGILIQPLDKKSDIKNRHRDTYRQRIKHRQHAHGTHRNHAKPLVVHEVSAQH